MITPPYLSAGDTVGVLCPAGFMDAGSARECLATLESWGYKVRAGKTLGQAFHYFSGTDEERLADLQSMLDDPDVKAILCARGGYGTSRIVDRLDFSAFVRNPKWVIGFSDITVLHAHLCTVLGTSSLHAPMAGAFNEGGASGPYVASLKAALSGQSSLIRAPAHSFNREGRATAPLVGGNLSLLVHLIGSISDMDTRGRILFIEDVGEYVYHIDRMMIQLSRCGRLEGLAGLIVGGFSEMKDTVRPFGQTVEALILDKVQAYGYPLCFGFPVSHERENYALKVGARYELEVGPTGVSLKE